jgi:hypothetical protein
MNQPLVVLTYPGHFLLTALTIQSYFKHHSIVPVTVVADDIDSSAWPEYLSDCAELYAPATIIPTSHLPEAQVFCHEGWIRQQIVKLYLDQLLSVDTWFFTDGDLEFNAPVPHNAVPYTITRGGPTQDQQNAYVSTLLNVTPGVFDPQQVCVSHPPFRTMHAQNLVRLREHVEQQLGCGFVDWHQQHLTHNGGDLNPDGTPQYLMSEWELLVTFQSTVLRQDIGLTQFQTDYTIGETPRTCGTCYDTDSAYSRDWWHDYAKIQVSDCIWNEISKISK